MPSCSPSLDCVVLAKTIFLILGRVPKLSLRISSIISQLVEQLFIKSCQLENLVSNAVPIFLNSSSH